MKVLTDEIIQIKKINPKSKHRTELLGFLQKHEVPTKTKLRIGQLMEGMSYEEAEVKAMQILNKIMMCKNEDMVVEHLFTNNQEMNKLIELCNADINKATFKNMMFLSFAEGGAMGCPGEIIFYIKTGEGYSLNYVYGDADLDKVKELCPVLQECFFGMFGIRSKVPAGWNYVNLGMGNHLIVNDEVYEDFTKSIDIQSEPVVIYNKWEGIAEKILDRNNSTIV